MSVSMWQLYTQAMCDTKLDDISIMSVGNALRLDKSYVCARCADCNTQYGIRVCPLQQCMSYVDCFACMAVNWVHTRPALYGFWVDQHERVDF